MKYVPAPDRDHLPSWQVEDGGFFLGLFNELGDVVATVHRPDGSRGHAYGGPVYEWGPEFRNCCIDDSHGLRTHELVIAEAFARKVGWT